MKRNTSILMILVLVLSNLGLAFGSHYCGEELIESKLIMDSSHEIDCGMETEECDNFSGLRFDTKDCCESIFNILQSDHLLISNFIEINLNMEMLVLEPDGEIYNSVSQENRTSLYSPPPPVPILRNGFQILFQSFLI